MPTLPKRGMKIRYPTILINDIRIPRRVIVLLLSSRISQVRVVDFNGAKSRSIRRTPKIVVNSSLNPKCILNISTELKKNSKPHARGGTHEWE